MTHPFELGLQDLQSRIDEMVSVTFGDLHSQTLSLPMGNGFLPYATFQEAYEVLKRETGAFLRFTDDTLWAALRADALTFVVIRTILGLAPPEWADLAKAERGVDTEQNFARTLDAKVRRKRDCFSPQRVSATMKSRLDGMISIAVEYISRGAPPPVPGTLHRLDKVDTAEGLVSLQHAADQHVPYAVLLYERYLGRPFASHRDAVSSHVGDIMESAVESQLAVRHITFRKTGRAEKIPGYAQAPDFFVPTEFAASVIIEAKIVSDDGTARDKVARILRLAAMRDERTRANQPSFQVVACIDGRGFGVRRDLMAQMIIATEGKVFTMNTLDRLVDCTDLARFLPAQP